jgi:quercetin dioxygenase-like cupin family protein
MDTAAFEAALKRDGFTEIETKTMPPRPPTQPHTHPFDVRALVLGGEITITCDGGAHTYRTGEVFSMAAGRTHAETYGAGEFSYVIGRRNPSA